MCGREKQLFYSSLLNLIALGFLLSCRKLQGQRDAVAEALETVKGIEWAAALGDDDDLESVLVKFNHDVEHESCEQHVCDAIREKDVAALVVNVDRHQQYALQVCFKAKGVVMEDAFKQWMEDNGSSIEVRMDPEPVASELEYHVLPAMGIAPSNKALLRAKHTGAAKGPCTQEQLVKKLHETRRFSYREAEGKEKQLGNDVTDYEEVRDGPNVKHNEYVIWLSNEAVQCGGPNGARAGKGAHSLYQVLKQFVVHKRLWHVVLPGVRRAIRKQQDPRPQELEKALHTNIQFLLHLEAFQASEVQLDDQLKRFLQTIIDCIGGDDNDLYRQIVHEAVAEYLLSSFPPRGRLDQLMLSSIASTFALEQDDVRLAAELARECEPRIRIKDGLVYYLDDHSLG